MSANEVPLARHEERREEILRATRPDYTGRRFADVKSVIRAQVSIAVARDDGWLRILVEASQGVNDTTWENQRQLQDASLDHQRKLVEWE